MCYEFTKDYKILKTNDSSISVDDITSIKIRPSFLGYFFWIMTFFSAILMVTTFINGKTDLTATWTFIFLGLYFLSTFFYVGVINNGALKVYCNKSRIEYLQATIEEIIKNGREKYAEL